MTIHYCKKPRYFVDTEFIEDGKTIDLLSIAIVCSDGRELYRASTDANPSLASPWVREHVLPCLPAASATCDGKRIWAPRASIARDVKEFVIPSSSGVEFWGYYADYDWVALAQLFGTMMDLPSHFPRFCMDLKQLSIMVGSPPHPSQEGNEHDALEDARWNQQLYEFLRAAC